MSDITARLRSDGPTDAADTRFRHRAEHASLIDVAYRTLDSPYGALLLAATPQGLVRVGFAGEGHERVLTDLAARISPRILHLPGRLDAAAHQLDGYFARRRRTFDVALDLRLATGFRREVLTHLRRIAYGSTQSYADVARSAGRPAAVRAVGGACSHNPLPVVVPCHRVVRSDGSTGAYLGGPEVKQALLAMESAP